MDTLTKLSDIKDVELQALLSHSLRYSLQHNVIAAQAEAQTDNPAAGQAVIIHKDTANLLKMLVDKILELQPAPKPPTKAAAKKAAKKKA